MIILIHCTVYMEKLDCRTRTSEHLPMIAFPSISGEVFCSAKKWARLITLQQHWISSRMLGFFFSFFEFIKRNKYFQWYIEETKGKKHEVLIMGFIGNSLDCTRSVEFCTGLVLSQNEDL